MLMSIEDLVKQLKSSANLDNTSSSVEDSVLSGMEDGDFILLIKSVVSRDYPNVQDLSDLPNGCEYAILLLAKIELYNKLAVAEALSIDLTADNNNQLKQSQRFDHYMKLCNLAKEQYNDYKEDSISGGGVQTYTSLLSRNHYKLGNYERGVAPQISLIVDDVTDRSVDLRWNLLNFDYFRKYKLYICKQSNCIDMYREGEKLEDKITDEAMLIKSTHEIHDCYHRIRGLEPNTIYYACVVAIERNGLFGYKQIQFTTLEDDDKDFSVDDLGEETDDSTSDNTDSSTNDGEDNE